MLMPGGFGRSKAATDPLAPGPGKAGEPGPGASGRALLGYEGDSQNVRATAASAWPRNGGAGRARLRLDSVEAARWLGNANV